jgi:aspartate kinase
MKVLKFGGTSVGSALRIRNVAKLVLDAPEGSLVVLSAMSGTTNSLLQISGKLQQGDKQGASAIINELKQKYMAVAKELLSDASALAKAEELINAKFDYIASFVEKDYTLQTEKCIVAQGEILSTNLLTLYLKEEQAKDVCLLSAFDFMHLDKEGEPDFDRIETGIKATIEKAGKHSKYITQGFICLNANGDIDNLQRGGSDYTASILGAALQAEEIQIWTDIDGMHNNDPRYVENTTPVRRLNFDEAAELAYFGAKILHPTCILPARKRNVPVLLLNTMEPEAPGTIISNVSETHKIKAVAAKTGITAIKIKSSRMLMAYGFLRKVFEVFETYRTPIDMITTSEVGVSLTIDNCDHLPQIVKELESLGDVTVDNDMVIICVVGDMKWDNLGFESKVIEAMKEVPIRMISYGGSNYNISILLKSQDMQRALQALSNNLF